MCKFSSNIKTSFQTSSWSYCAYIVVLIKKVWYSLKNGWDVVVFSLQKIKLLEGDAILSYEIELPFHMSKRLNSPCRRYVFERSRMQKYAS
jgi:hypothetical protein